MEGQGYIPPDIKRKVATEVPQDEKDDVIQAVEHVASAVKELGLDEKVFLFGGLVADPDFTRHHKDVDLIVIGRENAQKLIDKLVANGHYESPSQDVASKELPFAGVPPTDPNQPFIEIQWVDPDDKALGYYRYPMSDEYQEAVGKPLGLPKSAFSGDQVRIGDSTMRYIYPEFIFLGKGPSAEDKDRYDKFMMKAKGLNRQRIITIAREMKTIGIDPHMKGVEDIQVPEKPKSDTAPEGPVTPSPFDQLDYE